MQIHIYVYVYKKRIYLEYTEHNSYGLSHNSLLLTKHKESRYTDTGTVPQLNK